MRTKRAVMQRSPFWTLAVVFALALGVGFGQADSVAAEAPRPATEAPERAATPTEAKAVTPTVGKAAVPALKIVVRKPQPGELERLGVSDWPVWTRGPGDLPWTYRETEICYILEGAAAVVAEGQQASFGPGDLVVFPAGLACTWKITQAIKKHYQFGDVPPAPEKDAAAAGAELSPPGWDQWDPARRDAWTKSLEWAKHVVAVRSEEAGLKVGQIGANIAFVERAARKGVDPKVVMDAVLKSLESAKSPQALLREQGVSLEVGE